MATEIRTTQSLVAVAENALAEARESMPKFAHPFLSKDFTEHQLYAIQVLRRFLGTDTQGAIDKLADTPELRQALGLAAIPDPATLFQADARLTRKGFLQEF
jgi:hypothetical protein